MGTTISFVDSLIITAFSMAVVFVGLIFLALLVSVLKSIGGNKEVAKKKEPIVEVKPKEPMADTVVHDDDDELIAVIAAAVAASLGVSVPEVNIKSIRRIPQSTPAWSTAGRQEQIYGKL